MIKLAMFDWNGTMLDDLWIAHEGVVEVFKSKRLPPPSLEEYQNEITPDIVTFYYQRGYPNSGDPKKDLAEMTVHFKKKIEEHWKDVELSPYANALMRCCETKNIPCVLITMDSEETIKRRLVQFKLDDKFSDVIPRAPKKSEIMREMLKKYGVDDPRKAFYIGDTVGDVEAAKAASVIAIAYTGGYNSRERLEAAKPDLLVDSLWDVVLWLTKDDPTIDIGW